jgi:hypothetical protein
MKIICSACQAHLGELNGNYSGTIMYPEFYCQACYYDPVSAALEIGQHEGVVEEGRSPEFLQVIEGLKIRPSVSESQENLSKLQETAVDSELLMYLELAKQKKTN